MTMTDFYRMGNKIDTARNGLNFIPQYTGSNESDIASGLKALALLYAVDIELKMEMFKHMKEREEKKATVEPYGRTDSGTKAS